MLSVFWRSAVCSVLLTSTAFAQITAEDIQTRKKDQEFEAMMSTLDLSEPQYQLNFKDTGTSVGLKVEVGGEKLGKYMPRNSAADPESQRVSYGLARFLHMTDLVPMSSYYVLEGQALRTFETMLLNSNEKNKWRQYNKEQVLYEITANPNALFGIFVGHVKNDAEVLELADPPRNTINPNHPIARFIRADGPMPTEKSMSLKGIKAKDGSIPTSTEVQLAREFSQIMVLDALIGQWDRWSGGNVEAVAEKSGRVRFIARDNGGGGMKGTKNTSKTLGLVSRFDRGQYQRLQRLNDLLYVPKTAEEVVKAIGLRTNVRSLQDRVSMVLLHIQQQEQTFGEKAFFPESNFVGM